MIYFDNHATTKCDSRVLDEMLPYFDSCYGNASSTTHQAGRKAANAVETARFRVAKSIGANPSEILLTAGATESNNLVIQGIASEAKTTRRQIVTTPTEHKSVLVPLECLENQGYQAVYLPVDETGLVNLKETEQIISENTLLVSVQAANNEVGTIQPIVEIAAIAHQRGALIHCDAAQAIGKIPVDVDEWSVDLLSISAHKFYGPKGIGALYIRGGPFSLPIKPLVFGGGQEHELRPGTLNVPGIVGMGVAASLCMDGLSDEVSRVGKLRDRLEQHILNSVDDVKVNGDLNRRLAGNSSLTFIGLDAEALIVNTPELAISTGSACTSGAPEPSHVLLAVGMSRLDAYSTIRIGLGRFTTKDEVDQAAEMIISAVRRLRNVQVKSRSQSQPIA